MQVQHPQGVDAAEAVVDFPASVAAEGVAASLGNPAGYHDVAAADRASGKVQHPTRGSVKSTLIATITSPPGDPSAGCKTAVWGLEPSSGDAGFGGVWLDVGCSPA